MPVSIQAIRVKNLGPIAEIDWELGSMNIIYGHNEQGKTCLVEFLLRSLFQSTRHWSLRDITGSGRVLVEGLGDDITAFSPDSSRKLDTYWQEHNLGYPSNLARLLVVKGAELEMVRDADGGVDRAIIRHFLSQTAVLEKITHEIQKTISQASIENGAIVGSNMGLLKERNGLRQELNNVEDLLQTVNKEYTSGRLAALERREAELEEQLETQQKAKRHLAHELQEKQNAIRKKLEAYPLGDLDLLEKYLEALDRLSGEKERKRKQAEALAGAAGDFAWLKQALDVLKEHPAVGKAPSYWLLSLSILSLLGGIAAAYVQQPILAAVAAAVGVGLAGWYVRQWALWQAVRPDEDARAELRKAFRDRFDLEEADEPAMRVKLDELREQDSRHSILLEELEGGQREQREIGSQIRSMLRRLKRTALSESEWNSAAAGLREERTELDQEDNALALELARLNVSIDDGEPAPVDVSYNPVAVEKLVTQLAEVHKEIEQEKQAFTEVKATIRQYTGAGSGDQWDELLQQLQAVRNEKATAYRALTARIIGQNLTAKSIEAMLAEEDDNITARLQSELVQKPLKAITGRYERVEMVGDALVVSDAYQSFPLDELSTGAQEQVLLALRMAFAAQLLGDEQLFLVLDDAFQYADWTRRERLVDQVMRLGKAGWQILYLTMDDHIQELFEKKGKKAFGVAFRSHTLT